MNNAILPNTGADGPTVDAEVKMEPMNAAAAQSAYGGYIAVHS